jgi:hypothetical protein
MAMEGLRGYLQLASGLAEMSRARATEAASALLSLSAGLSGGGGPGRNVQGQVQDLAEELLAAAAANRRSLIALIRSEVERAVVSSGLPADELERARAAVAKLSADVEELRAQVLSNPAVGEVASRLGLGGHGQSRPADPFAGAADEDFGSTRADSGDGVVVDAVFTGPVDEPVAAPPRRRPPRKQIADQAATKAVPATQAAAKKSAARKTAATRKATAAPAKQASTRSSTPGAVSTTVAGPTATPTKAAAKKSTTKAATKKAATKKAATKKAATKKAATKKAATKKAATKKAATKKAATKKAATKETATKKAATSGAGGGS